MYRLLKCSKDAYVTNKFINGSRSLDANVGQAGTLDLFKLYNETTVTDPSGSGIELSRLLVKFDLDPLFDLTSSILDINSPSFKCYMNLKDVYGGQVVPSNFTVVAIPMALDWDEGRGSDVVAYRDIDTANFLSASSVALWNSSGASATGSVGTANLDAYVLRNSASIVCSQTFDRGDEDLLIDITTIVSGTIAGWLPDYGIRLSFTSSQEEDSVTRFVKRFGSRHVKDTSLKPRLVVKYNDAISDDNQMLFFDVSNTLFFYNNYRGTSRNFFSGAVEITGSNSLILTLATSHSVTYQTSSYQTNFSASVSYFTSSLQTYTQSFTGSQLFIGGNAITGVYYCTFTPSSNNTFFSGSFPVGFSQFWQSLDGTVTYVTGNFVQVDKINGGNTSVQEKNLVTNVTNLKDFYTADEVSRLRVFVQDYNTEVVSYRVPQLAKPAVFKNMHWRLLEAFSRDVIIPFDMDTNATLLSSDASGMYFDLYMSDLDLNHVYELEFMIRENGKDYLIVNEGFRFKVMA
jgi:hypothetical protein